MAKRRRRLGVCGMWYLTVSQSHSTKYVANSASFVFEGIIIEDSSTAVESRIFQRGVLLVHCIRMRTWQVLPRNSVPVRHTTFEICPNGSIFGSKMIEWAFPSLELLIASHNHHHDRTVLRNCYCWISKWRVNGSISGQLATTGPIEIMILGY